MMQAPPAAVAPPAGARGTPAAGSGRRFGGPACVLLLLLLLGVQAAATIGAMRETSTTFDEIVLVAGGARGFATGAFDIAPEHPPLTQYLYGLPVHLTSPVLPPAVAMQRGDMAQRYVYARTFFWLSGNDAERLAFIGRLPAVLCALLLTLLVFLWTRTVAGPRIALAAAFLVAGLPDVLAHGGIAYNDVPLATAFFGALWAIDRALRRPTAVRGALAGALVAVAFLTKFSAIVLLPAAGLLLIAQALGAGEAERRSWLRAMPVATVALLVSLWATLVVGYRGDLLLEELRYGLGFTFFHVNEGHGVPAYLLGQRSTTGWAWFYPVAFLLKTPAALHLLAAVAAAGLLAGMQRAGSVRERLVRAAASPLRMPLVGAATFGAALLTSSLAIGFRYALPLLPFLCVLVAIGVARHLAGAPRWQQGGVAALFAWYAASVLLFYPNFIAYTSEYVPDRQRGDSALLDSSLDWGQGLVQLRRLLAAEGIDRVYLSYFGSALPGGYGIRFEPLPSFFPLFPHGSPQAAEEPPRYMVISATNLHGIYLPGDPFARFRDVEPDHIVARSLYVFRLHD
jgi:4-amino-4-deoxy-L-arabinose transferase-like glycosyltransferase